MTNAALQIETSVEIPEPQLQVLPPPPGTNDSVPAAKDNGDCAFPQSKIENQKAKIAAGELHVGIAGLPPTDFAPLIQQSNDPSIQPLPRASKPKVRNGKIARLPFTERDMVNRMLRDHIPYKDIVGALAEHGIYVTERNVSNWKTRGGYKEWAAEQDRALTNRLTQDNLVEHLRKNDAGQLAEVGLQIAATNLSQFFLRTQTQETLATNPASCRQPIADACRLARHIHNFQKYRDDTAKELGFKYHPERARREEERLTEITRDVYSAAKLGDGPNEPDVTPRRNFIPKEPPPAFPDPLY